MKFNESVRRSVKETGTLSVTGINAKACARCRFTVGEDANKRAVKLVKMSKCRAFSFDWALLQKVSVFGQ